MSLTIFGFWPCITSAASLVWSSLLSFPACVLKIDGIIIPSNDVYTWFRIFNYGGMVSSFDSGSM